MDHVDTPPPEQPSEPMMEPTQALTTPFESGGDIGGSEHKEENRHGPSRQASGEPRQGFRVGQLRLMIRYEDSSELSEMFPVHHLPNAPEWFCGMSNLHGRLIPVFDLARYIGVDADVGAKRMLLVLARGVDAAGVIIDGLPERLHLSEENRAGAESAPARLASHLRGASFIDERLWFDLDIPSLLDRLEQGMAT